MTEPGQARPLPALLLLLILRCCWGPGYCRASEGEGRAAPLSQLRAQVSGVEELLEEFRQQVQQQRQGEQLGLGDSQGLHHLQGEPLSPGDAKEVHLMQGEARRPGDLRGSQQQTDMLNMWAENYPEQQGDPQIPGEEQGLHHLKQLQDEGRHQPGKDSCEDRFTILQDYIIRTKDSLGAGATFLRAPKGVLSWHQCLRACCEDPQCTVAVVELSESASHQRSADLSCYLFDCTYRGQSVCTFSLHRGYSSFTSSQVNSSTPNQREAISNSRPNMALSADQEEIDEPPRSNAGRDVVLQLPTDWLLLDGRESIDDHGIIRYEWNLLHGDPSLDMKVPQPGTLQLSHLQEGAYTFQLTATDTAGQRSSDNITVTVLPMERRRVGCTGSCSRYQFTCDDGCCIDITLACDRVVQCPDGSDEAFCQNFGPDRKTVTQTLDSDTQQQKTMELPKAADRNLQIENDQRINVGKRPLGSLHTAATTQEVMENNDKFIPGVVSEDTATKTPFHPNGAPDRGSSVTAAEPREDNGKISSKGKVAGGGHPAPETGAVLPLALGLAITALLLLMVVCRLRLVRQKLKKARPLTTEESDYLINGMYL